MADNNNPIGWWSDHPSVDFVAAGVVVALHAAVTKRGHGDLLAWIESPQRQTLYAAGAGVVAVIGGLAAISLALYQSAEGDRSRALRAQYGDVMRRNWRGLLVVTGIASALCLIALATDRKHDPLSSRFIFEFALALWAARFVRLVWLFDRLLTVADKDLTDKPRPAAPEVSSRWQRRANTG